MTAVVFLGPTLPHTMAAAELEAIYLPPAAQGDVYRAALQRPAAIGIVDGYFDSVPAVWHKEILWALSEGIRVYGSASMGALRAAELWRFGMTGVGRIYEAYRDGALEDDDEVALEHAPAALDFVPLSEPLVNVRATLERAARMGVVSQATATGLEHAAKQLFYADRSWLAILAAGRAAGHAPDELEALGTFHRTCRVDQKRLDAVAMLSLMRAHLTDPPPVRVDFRFVHTGLWEQARRRAGELEVLGSQPAGAYLDNGLLDNLRLEGGDSWSRLRERALVRLALHEAARQQGLRVNEERLLEVVMAFRRERHLLTPQDLERWLAQNRLDRDQFLELMQRQARIASVEEQAGPEIDAEILRQQRVDGHYPALDARHRDKQALLAAIGWDGGAETGHGSDDDVALAWYARERLHDSLPRDLNRHAQALGFADRRVFMWALRREWRYVTATAAGD